MKCTALWYGGLNYGCPEGTDAEPFDSIRAAKDSFWSRADFDPYYPCVDDIPPDDGGPEMYLFLGEHYADVTDMYPDRRLSFGPRGGVNEERC